METLYAILGLASSLGIIISLITTIIMYILKKNQRKIALLSLIFFVGTFIIAFGGQFFGLVLAGGSVFLLYRIPEVSIFVRDQLINYKVRKDSAKIREEVHEDNIRKDKIKKQQANVQQVQTQVQTQIHIQPVVQQTQYIQPEDKKAGLFSSKEFCPSCRSLNVSFMQNNRKGFSVGKAIGGTILTGGIGSLAGFAGKKGKNQWHCNNCGRTYKKK